MSEFNNQPSNALIYYLKFLTLLKLSKRLVSYLIFSLVPMLCGLPLHVKPIICWISLLQITYIMTEKLHLKKQLWETASKC